MKIERKLKQAIGILILLFLIFITRYFILIMNREGTGLSLFLQFIYFVFVAVSLKQLRNNVDYFFGIKTIGTHINFLIGSYYALSLLMQIILFNDVLFPYRGPHNIVYGFVGLFMLITGFLALAMLIVNYILLSRKLNLAYRPDKIRHFAILPNASLAIFGLAALIILLPNGTESNLWFLLIIELIPYALTYMTYKKMCDQQGKQLSQKTDQDEL